MCDVHMDKIVRRPQHDAHGSQIRLDHISGSGRPATKPGMNPFAWRAPYDTLRSRLPGETSSPDVSYGDVWGGDT